MQFKIALGGVAAYTHPDSHLRIDKHEPDGYTEYTGEFLYDPDDAELARRLDAIEEKEVAIFTTFQGRYSLSMLGKVVSMLRDRGLDVTIVFEPMSEEQREFVRAPRIRYQPAMDTSTHLERLLKVFLCHCSSDKAAVRDLYARLVELGAEVWFDEERLIPGQDWNAEIQVAVSQSDLVIVCLSPKAVNKVGYVQKEIRYALDCADEQPEGAIYIVPVKLQECDVPVRLKRWQWLNLYEPGGLDRLARTLYARAAELRKRAEASKEA